MQNWKFLVLPSSDGNSHWEVGEDGTPNLINNRRVVMFDQAETDSDGNPIGLLGAADGSYFYHPGSVGQIQGSPTLTPYAGTIVPTDMGGLHPWESALLWTEDHYSPLVPFNHSNNTMQAPMMIQTSIGQSSPNVGFNGCGYDSGFGSSANLPDISDANNIVIPVARPLTDTVVPPTSGGGRDTEEIVGWRFGGTMHDILSTAAFSDTYFGPDGSDVDAEIPSWGTWAVSTINYPEAPTTATMASLTLGSEEGTNFTLDTTAVVEVPDGTNTETSTYNASGPEFWMASDFMTCNVNGDLTTTGPILSMTGDHNPSPPKLRIAPFVKRFQENTDNWTIPFMYEDSGSVNNMITNEQVGGIDDAFSVKSIKNTTQPKLYIKNINFRSTHNEHADFEDLDENSITFDATDLPETGSGLDVGHYILGAYNGSGNFTEFSIKGLDNHFYKFQFQLVASASTDAAYFEVLPYNVDTGNTYSDEDSNTGSYTQTALILEQLVCSAMSGGASARWKLIKSSDSSLGVDRATLPGVCHSMGIQCAEGNNEEDKRGFAVYKELGATNEWTLTPNQNESDGMQRAFIRTTALTDHANSTGSTDTELDGISWGLANKYMLSSSVGLFELYDGGTPRAYGSFGFIGNDTATTGVAICVSSRNFEDDTE